ncbi:class I SAM-dependent methyltransferase [Microbaculum marinum]|uniref:Class I SAM-dependent methyltransferase n=1 Tax=Microbaculum marinum TaxID=1764581 RepID=A0AAW9RR53_9HYPH
MSTLEGGVAELYSAYDVLDRIKTGLAEMGYSSAPVPLDVLKPVDEFHIGGAQATDYLLGQLDLDSGTRVLDIGSGIGGAARMIASRFGCPVTGIDLTPAFVDTARELTELCGMGANPSFQVASATALPFDAASFDLATMLHVGMNIPDKEAVFAEARRVLRADGVFAVYDVMRIGDGELTFPVPWADTQKISALAGPDVYKALAGEAGFTLVSEESRQAIALEFFEKIRAQAAESAPPPLGLHNLMGPSIGAKMSNMIAGIRADVIAPVLMIFQASANRG